MSQATADELAAMYQTNQIQNTNDGSQASQVSQVSQPGANDTTSTTTTTTTTTNVDADNNGSNDKPEDDDEISNDDLTPKTDITLTLKGTPEYNSFPFSKESEKFYFMASVEASYFKETDRAPIDLCCIIDESSSMSGDRIRLVKETVLFVLRNLTDKDRFGIIGYGSEAKTRLKLTKMNEEGKKKAEKIVESIRANGMTALCEGLEFGIKMMRNRNKDDSNQIASLMLFTDGQANVGPTTAVAIQKQIEGHGGNINNNNNNNSSSIPQNDEKENEGIRSPDYSLPCTINTFGFGNNHNESLLEGLAEWGRGMYTFIENTDTIGETFAECLGGLVSIVGRDLKVSVSSLNGVKILRCVSQGGYKVEETKSLQEFTIRIPDIQSEERRDLVFEVSLPKIDSECDIWPMAQISCSYHNIPKDKNEILSIIGNVNRCNDNYEIGERNDEVDAQCNRIYASEAMDIADKMAEKGDLRHARKILKKAKKQIEKSNTFVKQKKGYYKYAQNLVADVEDVRNDLSSRESYRSQGGKKLKMSKKAHAMQRSCHSSIYESQSGYTNSSKYAMMKKFSNK